MKNDTAKGCNRKYGTQCRYVWKQNSMILSRSDMIYHVWYFFQSHISHDYLCIYSPSQGPCCSSETCQFVPLSHKVQCRAESDCSYNSTCSGRSSECPAPLPKANKTRCNEGTQVNSLLLFRIWFDIDIFRFNDTIIYSCASTENAPDPFVWSGIWQSVF